MTTYAGRHANAGEPTSATAELLEVARAWAADDPDDATRAELEQLVAAAADGDAEAVTSLSERFGGLLEFGTAGLRGHLGAGPNRMNRSVVIRAAAGFAAYLKELHESFLVVVGYDARTNSDVFARDTASVVVAAGGSAAVLPHALPTPVLAFAVRHLGAAAGVMVTASHNPAQDNGYKVYLGDGCQICSPTDVAIARKIVRVESVASVPRADDGWQTLDDEVLEAYLDAVAGTVLPDSPRDLAVVHTSLHGVGNDTVHRAFERAGFPAPTVVATQAEPDPAFPTVTFPNPEEPGAIDAALALAAEVEPDLVIANDPDADRCAVAVKDGDTWRMLRGDEVGSLLGSHLVTRGVPEGGVFANSIVSSRMLAAIAAAAGVRHEETLTGFKWIARVEDLHYGYEEALGYCVAPGVVRDKDGISAALLVAELAAILKAEGRTLLDVLDDLELRHGVHATDSFSVRVEDLSTIGTVMARLRSEPPLKVAGLKVARLDDLAMGSEKLPPTDGVRWYLEDDSRIIVRPSGTEPKLKVYLEVIGSVEGDDALERTRLAARAKLESLREGMEKLTTP